MIDHLPMRILTLWEETRELCPVCDGRGLEPLEPPPFVMMTASTGPATVTSAWGMCRKCHGERFLITKKVLWRS
jgi:hypothetical protein